ncbi:glutamate synthase large subunit [Thermoflavimicrobium daqui]|uniref:Glutamate synthase large subunit n=1 Tax=Thermoflavimicrobium daqui TaxID=2137476 RepID=A0A364K4K0_9BACL|nr:glutamate synthase large subunit [Thermoflavimicrobium daqui]RAL24295.1 glutamate synthase large subunit [Thermoflavimicrobium daqui]
MKQGLYNPTYEHDACGVGFVANKKGKAKHEIVEMGLHILCQLVHRGGENDGTGDGSGIMIQIPHRFFHKICQTEGMNLPSPGKYGVGMLFLPQDPIKRNEYERKLEHFIQIEGQKLLGWRTAPINSGNISNISRESQPVIRQVFIGANPNIENQQAFERKLYIIRKQLEKEIDDDLYVVSLSSRTLVYKGLLTPSQLRDFYIDFQDPTFASAFAMVHNRFSTNTFPSWKRAHPNRYILHNGEINTLRGNVNWMLAREKMFQSDVFQDELEKVFPILDVDGSDSAILDNCFEFLALSGRSLPHVAMMMIPEPWEHDQQMSAGKKAFYEYHSCLMEPWDGPTAIAFSDGKQIGAILDRNGLRPARYYITSNDLIIFSSEVGVIDVPEEMVIKKERLQPGQMLLVDLEKGRIIADDELKEQIAQESPYRSWIDQNLIDLESISLPQPAPKSDLNNLVQLQKAFGYTYEEIHKQLLPMVTEGKDPIGSMGSDTPLAVLSDRPQLLYNYFKQSFAQVTNPPIDALREKCVTSTMTLLGSEGNLLKPAATHCRRIRLSTPIISDLDLVTLRKINQPSFKAKTFPILFSASQETELETALEKLFSDVDQAISEEYNLLILSDRGISRDQAAIPALLAVSGLHHYLVRQGTRTKVSILVESGEPRDVHHLSLLIGYGADAINPYLAFATIQELIETNILNSFSYTEAIERYIQTATEGIVKVMSKMGISTIQSYRGAQIFEAIGIDENVIEKYFTRTSSPIGGIPLEMIAKEVQLRHQLAFDVRSHVAKGLESGSELQWRRNGEHHAFNPHTIHTLQQACRRNNYSLFKKFSGMVNNEQTIFIRNLFDFKSDRQPIPLEEVEPVESIVRRFKSGAMSYGSLSKEAHETLAIAMNRLGGKSNSGEGGEDPIRFAPDENGDLRRSAIKQVASGRFGVNSHYLLHADEIQIKMAQGAKPGEGGQLPGNKVYPWIAEVRGSTAGVGLISPPPHHDIYSIEDLAQLIHDLKNANPSARISVKLVSKLGVGTIAAGVAKGLADVIVISGHDGGTGASPRTSIKHAGMPWELGLAETHQTLLLNNLRDRVVLEADGKMMTGRDVVFATLFGAEEYGFATAPLIVLGCIMMRACHLDTCPVGVATQNPVLRKKFMGKPEHVINYMRFIAQEVREIMAHLGFKSIDEMIGRTDILKVSERTKTHWKTRYLDLSSLLYQPDLPKEIGKYHQKKQDHQLEKSFDYQKLLPLSQPALDKGDKVEATLTIRNTDRVVGTILGSQVTKQYGTQGLPEDTIHIKFKGSAGQSFGAFIPKGMTLDLEGDANDYIGKGLSGGKIIVSPSHSSPIVPEKNVVIGNVAFYGATAGEAFIHGLAGERFAVRNSGVQAVVEGVGDHGCEYMTGGRVVILGSVGKNFAAGMSGGIAYVLVEDEIQFIKRCNQEMVSLERLVEKDEIEQVRQLIEKHVKYTSSRTGQTVLEQWSEKVKQFVKVIPKDFKIMWELLNDLREAGYSSEEAATIAFEQYQKRQQKANEKVKEAIFA